jgi:beta-glucosidase
MTSVTFPPGFLWGAATSAYQIEGSPLADGAGPSIWHRFSRHPGMTHQGQTGDLACDHYRRYRDDVALMKGLGLKAYRFSIAWGRVLPEGTGAVNQAGLDFYKRLVDELVRAGIEPMATLYHWDLPAALDDRGGWLNRDVAEWFADYARVMFSALDGGVKKWATLNEPWVVVDGGYLHGVMAPGHRSIFEAPIAANNLMRAHGAAIRSYRGEGTGQIGLVVNLEPKYPASESPEDMAAAQRTDAYMNRQYLDPALLGRWPEEMRELYGEGWQDFDDFDLIRQKLDFLGVNYYSRGLMKHDDSRIVERATRAKNPGADYTAMNWEIYPQGLTDTLVWIRDRYGALPIYITENGAAIEDPETADGPQVDDPRRVAYLRQHLAAVASAIEQGVDVRGYYVWSLLDNYEWAAGFSKRFGIIHVDYRTQKRTPKTSALFYSGVIRNNGF